MTKSSNILICLKRFPDWQKEFEAVLVEGNIEKLPRLIEIAEAAIFLRLQALTLSSDTYAERNAISDALRTLRALKSEKIHISEITRLPIIRSDGRRKSTGISENIKPCA